MNHTIARHCALALLAVVLLPLALSAQPARGNGYQTPAPVLQALVDAPRPPQLFLSPRRDTVALVQTPALPGITDVAQPELKLAGTRISGRPRRASGGGNPGRV